MVSVTAVYLSCFVAFLFLSTVILLPVECTLFYVASASWSTLSGPVIATRLSTRGQVVCRGFQASSKDQEILEEGGGAGPSHLPRRDHE